LIRHGSTRGGLDLRLCEVLPGEREQSRRDRTAAGVVRLGAATNECREHHDGDEPAHGDVFVPPAHGCQDGVLYSAAVQRSLVALVLVTVVLVVFAPIVLGGQTWEDTRYHLDVAPARIAAADAVLGGTLPIWWEGTGLGVPLLGEPSHGAAYPIGWFAATPLSHDLLLVVHALWCALGVALWSRRLGASALGAVVAGVLVVTSGLVASAALRGALPALAHVPWIALVASRVAAAPSRASRARHTAALGALLGLVGLAGQLVIFVHALALALLAGIDRQGAQEPRRDQKSNVSSATRRLGGLLLLASFAGVAISSVQWLPAIFVLGDSAGATVEAMPLSRVVELLVPLRHGDAWFPSVFVGAPLLVLAVLGEPCRRLAIFVAVLGIAALVVGRGGSWPHVLGAPELHVATLGLVAAAHAGAGFETLVAGERRALLALVGGAVALGLALGGVVALRARVDGEQLLALERALISGGLGFSCIVAVVAVMWRVRGSGRTIDIRSLLLAVLVIAPSVGSLPIIAPTIDRAIVATAPAWVERALAPAEVTIRDGGDTVRGGPLRVFRPVMSFERAANPVRDTRSLADALATLGGTSAAKWGVGTARSEDPARLAVHDRVWLGAAAAGGQLLDRYGITLAIVPGSVVAGRGLAEVASRDDLALVRYPASPNAALVYEWIFVDDVATAIARLFPPGAGRGLGSGLVVLQGRGAEHQDEPTPAQPCTIERWEAGAIDLSCDATAAAYAVVSSTPARGWSVTVDDREAPWLVADVLRRAVAAPRGEHRIAWRYHAPGLRPALVIAALGLVLLVASWLWYRRDRDEPPDAETETSA
jgi:hypothetical protein